MLLRRYTWLNTRSGERYGFSIEYYMASIIADVPNLPKGTTTTNPTVAKVFYHVPVHYTTVLSLYSSGYYLEMLK
jgi:hypothetical protein